MAPPDFAAHRDDSDACDPPPSIAPPSSGHPDRHDNALWDAALEASAGGTAPGNLPIAWDDLARGQLRVCSEGKGHQRMYVVAWLHSASSEERPCLDHSETTLVARLLCGEPQKALTTDFGMSPSTVSSRQVRALIKLGLSGREVPLPIVLAAQSWLLGSRIQDARSAPFTHQGTLYRVLSVPRPAPARLPGLTPAEQDVAQLLLEGFSRAEIARQREASVNTVGGQISSVFSALRVTGRYALSRAAVDLGCFD